jgi:hypothetical protein
MTTVNLTDGLILQKKPKKLLSSHTEVQLNPLHSPQGQRRPKGPWTLGRNASVTVSCCCVWPPHFAAMTWLLLTQRIHGGGTISGQLPGNKILAGWLQLDFRILT